MVWQLHFFRSWLEHYLYLKKNFCVLKYSMGHMFLLSLKGKFSKTFVCIKFSHLFGLVNIKFFETN